MSSPEDKEFQIAIGAVEDSRKLIAAGKVQRWDVVKWGVSVNLALTVASALADMRLTLLLLSSGVAYASWRLVIHYNRRMTGARDRAIAIINWLKSKGIDCDAIFGTGTQTDYLVGEDYDLQELRLFLAILAASPILILFGLILLNGTPQH
jgi:hypothetical protein